MKTSSLTFSQIQKIFISLVTPPDLNYNTLPYTTLCRVQIKLNTKPKIQSNPTKPKILHPLPPLGPPLDPPPCILERDRETERRVYFILFYFIRLDGWLDGWMDVFVR